MFQMMEESSDESGELVDKEEAVIAEKHYTAHQTGMAVKSFKTLKLHVLDNDGSVQSVLSSVEEAGRASIVHPVDQFEYLMVQCLLCLELMPVSALTKQKIKKKLKLSRLVHYTK